MIVVALSGCTTPVSVTDAPANDTQNYTQALPPTTPITQPSVSKAPKQIYIYPNDTISFIYQYHNISIEYLTSNSQHKIWISIDGKERTIIQDRAESTGDSGYYYTEDDISVSIRPVVWKSDFDNDGLIGEDPIDGIDNDGDGLIDEDTVDKVWSFETWDTDELYVQII